MTSSAGHLPAAGLRALLNTLRARYNRRCWAERDPVRFVWCQATDRDREVAGLIAAMLAYGQVDQILRSVADALGRLPENYREVLVLRHQEELSDSCL